MKCGKYEGHIQQKCNDDHHYKIQHGQIIGNKDVT